MNIPESTLIALADESLGFTDQGTPEHIAVREMARELLAHRANTDLAKAEQALAELKKPFTTDDVQFETLS